MATGLYSCYNISLTIQNVDFVAKSSYFSLALFKSNMVELPHWITEKPRQAERKPYTLILDPALH